MSGESEKILEAAIAQFFKLGIRSVTMEHLAEVLGMSKKTLYVHYKNKADLVDKSVHHLFETVSARISAVSESEMNAIDELFAIDTIVCSQTKAHHPAMLFELSKYYPDTYQSLIKKREGFVKRITESNLRKGIRQGLYRDDLNIWFITEMYYGKMMLLNIEEYFAFENQNAAEVYHQNLLYHLRGIVSAKGYAYLENREQKTTKP